MAYDVPDDALEVRVPVKAGPRVVGVTFVRKTGALLESVREPFFTPHAEGGTRSQPSVASVTIAGPFAPTGVSETPSRQRIFACRPANRQAEAACARQILSQLAREDRIRVVDEFKLAEPKTKLLAQKVRAMGFEEVLLITDEVDQNLELSARNLPNVAVLPVRQANPVALVRFPHVLFTRKALAKLEEMYK